MFFFAAALSFVQTPLARASQLSFVSDTISDSRPSLPINHAIIFKTTSGIPASGKIVIAFEKPLFSVDPLFSYSDVDLAFSTTSPSEALVERSLAAIPDDTNDGVAVASIGGPITITLSSGSGIPAGSYIRILLGTNTPRGTYQIANPSATASYRILLNTYDAAGGAIDYGAAMVVILPAVGVGVNTDKVNPAVLSNGLPSGTIPSNVTGVLISFNTDTYATCRYMTYPGVSYDAMTNITTDNSLGTFHTFMLASVVRGNTYAFYVRCEDFAGNKNPNDYIISFYAGDPTGTGLGGGTVPSTGVVTGGSISSNNSGGGGGGGGGAPYPALPASPSLVISGVAMPSAGITVLQDGSALFNTAVADSSGNFSVSIPSLPQGTYSFTVEVLNGGSTPISSYTTTITLVSGTTNAISGVVLPPSIGFVTSTVALRKPFLITGLGEPSSTIDLFVIDQSGSGSPFEATTTADNNGVWSYALPTAGFSMGTYQVKARSSVPLFAASVFSSVSYLGIGEEPTASLKIGDLNGDGKVNLVDFSIILAHWGTSYEPDDLNGDGKVDLPDLSIMLAHWTG